MFAVPNRSLFLKKPLLEGAELGASDTQGLGSSHPDGRFYADSSLGHQQYSAEDRDWLSIQSQTTARLHQEPLCCSMDKSVLKAKREALTAI